MRMLSDRGFNSRFSERRLREQGCCFRQPPHHRAPARGAGMGKSVMMMAGSKMTKENQKHPLCTGEYCTSSLLCVLPAAFAALSLQPPTGERRNAAAPPY